MTLTAELVKDERVVWRSTARSDLPIILNIKQDQSVQDAATQATMPKADSYLEMELPLHVAQQPRQGPFGIIELGLNGVGSEKYAQPVSSKTSDF